MARRDRAPASSPTPSNAPPDTFETLFREHFREIYAYTRARLGPEEGEDVAAECFQAAAERFDAGRGDEVTIRWLMAVARNKVIDRWRRAATRTSHRHLVAVPDAEADGVAALVERSVRRDAVLAALDQLTQRHRSMLILFHVDGCSVREIAEQLGVTEVNVHSALARARRAFRRKFCEPEVDDGR